MGYEENILELFFVHSLKVFSEIGRRNREENFCMNKRNLAESLFSRDKSFSNEAMLETINFIFFPKKDVIF